MIQYHLIHGTLGYNDGKNMRGNFHVSNEGMITKPMRPLDPLDTSLFRVMTLLGDAALVVGGCLMVS